MYRVNGMRYSMMIYITPLVFLTEIRKLFLMVQGISSTHWGYAKSRLKHDYA
jgi:hypothetical protein